VVELPGRSWRRLRGAAQVGASPSPMEADTRSSPPGHGGSRTELPCWGFAVARGGGTHRSRLLQTPCMSRRRRPVTWLHRAVVSPPTHASPPRRAIGGLCSTTTVWVLEVKGGKRPYKAWKAAFLRLRPRLIALESGFLAASPAKLFWDPFGTTSSKTASEAAGEVVPNEPLVLPRGCGC
jgi:hypothetical protein